jgi:hypothetical protein
MPTTFRSDEEISEVKKAIATYVDEVCNLGTDIHVFMYGCRDFYGTSATRIVEIDVGYRNGIYGKTLEITIPRG